MSSFKFYQTPDDNSMFLHPLAPGAHGVGGYCRAPGSFGNHNFSNHAEKFGELNKIADPFSPAMKNGGAEEVKKIEEEMAYGPEDAPKTMRNKNWSVAAGLIEYWLHGNAKIMPESVRTGKDTARSYGAISTGIVTMAFVQGFARANTGISLLKGKMDKENTKKSILNVVKKNYPGISLNEKTRLSIDNSLLDVVDLHTNWQFQYEQVGSQFDTLDHLTAALGRFSLMAAIRKAEIKDGVITVNEIGIYVRDVFDFSGSQPFSAILFIWLYKY